MGQIIKCAVLGCKNHSNQGKFIGKLCAPCYDYLINGTVQHKTYAQAFENAVTRETLKVLLQYNTANVIKMILDELEEEIKNGN